jgi:hypothetical protein
MTLIAFLSGCASQTVSTEDLNCSNTPDCRLHVFVKCTGSCATAVDHERVIGKRNGEIVWEMQNQAGQAYAFDRVNGIVFPADLSANFRCHVEANGARFSCTNRGDRGQYKYTVNLVGSPAVRPLDPWVVNN